VPEVYICKECGAWIDYTGGDIPEDMVCFNCKTKDAQPPPAQVIAPLTCKNPSTPVFTQLMKDIKEAPPDRYCHCGKTIVPVGQKYCLSCQPPPARQIRDNHFPRYIQPTPADFPPVRVSQDHQGRTTPPARDLCPKCKEPFEYYYDERNYIRCRNCGAAPGVPEYSLSPHNPPTDVLSYLKKMMLGPTLFKLVLEVIDWRLFWAWWDLSRTCRKYYNWLPIRTYFRGALGV
jgi:hypothetical protein